MAAAKQTTVELPTLSISTVNIPIIGDSPLIVHAWSAKAKQILLDSHMQKAKKGREPKVPFNDFTASLYWLSEHEEVPTEDDVENGRFGFPSVAFKAAAVAACTSIAAMTKIGARQAFHLDGEFVEILGPAPSMREDITRLNGLTPDVRFRGEFSPWGAILTVKINTTAMSEAQVLGLFDLAGFAVGVGEWRPGGTKTSGPYGRFHVAKSGEAMPCR